MDREFILGEIRRLAAELDGRAPGKRRFERVTGITESTWYPTMFRTWSDAVEQAGLAPNEMQQPYSESELLSQLARLTLELGAFPAKADIQLQKYAGETLANEKVFRNRLGDRATRIRKLLQYSREQEGLEEVAAICESELGNTSDATTEDIETPTEPRIGFVYLMKSGKHYKIGMTYDVGRRRYDIGLKTPEPVKVLHEIRTSDPPGVESYWHRRFQSKRGNGEWFLLTPHDIRAFKSWKGPLL